MSKLSRSFIYLIQIRAKYHTKLYQNNNTIGIIINSIIQISFRKEGRWLYRCDPVD